MSIFTLPWFARPSRGPRQHYTGEQLRAIRKKNGVGRLPKLYRADQQRPYPSLWASVLGEISPNFIEWLRKPRKRNAVTPKSS